MAKKLSFKKRILFLSFAFIGCLISIDIGLQIIYVVMHGEFTWNTINETEQFCLGGYIYQVPDERYATLKRNYQGSIATDEHGFRIGNHKLSRSEDNIVFIGDSVPFGWQLKAHDTVPSRLSDILKERGKTANIINAAIPSSSLNQAVYRYKYEISDRFSVDIVILQIYDPAVQFAQLGKEWDVSKNWVTWSEKIRSKIGGKGIFSIDSSLRYSSLFYLYWRFSGQYYLLSERLDINDHEAINKYVGSINDSLDTLYRECHSGEVIVLLPITITKEGRRKLSLQMKKAIEILNRTMLDYSKMKPEVCFLDTIGLFNDFKDQDIFRDNAGHLSPQGARLQAEFIADFLAEIK